MFNFLSSVAVVFVGLVAVFWVLSRVGEAPDDHAQDDHPHAED